MVAVTGSRDLNQLLKVSLIKLHKIPTVTMIEERTWTDSKMSDQYVVRLELTTIQARILQKFSPFILFLVMQLNACTKLYNYNKIQCVVWPNLLVQTKGPVYYDTTTFSY